MRRVRCQSDMDAQEPTTIKIANQQNPVGAAGIGAAERGQHRNYNQQFKRYLARNIAYTIRLVEAAGSTLTDELRQQAWHTLSYALDERPNWPAARELLLSIAPKMEWAGYRKDWLLYLQRGLAQALALEDQRAIAECQLQIGMIYRMLGDFDLAHEHLLASVHSNHAAQSPRDQARALNELAWLKQLQQQYKTANQHVEQALALLAEDDPERAMSYRVLGMVAMGHKQWAEAAHLHQLALHAFQALGDERRTAWSIQNFGYALYGQQRYDEAIELYHQAAAILEAIDDPYHWSIVQNNLGIAYHAVGHSEAAIGCYERAAEVAQRIHDKLQLAKLYNNFGLVYLDRNEYTEAQSHFEQSAQLHEMLGNVVLWINARDGLAIVLLAQGRHAEAKKILQDALETLPQIKDTPQYTYLSASLAKHLEQAER